MRRPVRVVPAILTDNPDRLESMLRQAETFADYLQIDIMDGSFVPSKSIGTKHLTALSIATAWEAHLMVDNPQDYLEDFKKAGARRAIFHFEATKNPVDVFNTARKLGLPIGVAINPDTPIDAVLLFSDKINCLLFLSVNPGFYGSPFIPEVLEKIGRFRSLGLSVETGIDGGIKEENIAEVAKTGVNYICVGSAIFLQPDPAASYRRLCELGSKASA